MHVYIQIKSQHVIIEDDLSPSQHQRSLFLYIEKLDNMDHIDAVYPSPCCH